MTPQICGLSSSSPSRPDPISAARFPRTLPRQRLNPDERVAVLIPQPQARERSRLLHFHVAHVGFMRQQIFSKFPRLSIQPDREIVVHSGPPEITLIVELRVVRTRPRRGNLPLGYLFGLGIEHRQRVAVKCATPHAVLRIDVSPPAASALR